MAVQDVLKYITDLASGGILSVDNMSPVRRTSELFGYLPANGPTPDIMPLLEQRLADPRWGPVAPELERMAESLRDIGPSWSGQYHMRGDLPGTGIVQDWGGEIGDPIAEFLQAFQRPLSRKAEPSRLRQGYELVPLYRTAADDWTIAQEIMPYSIYSHEARFSLPMPRERELANQLATEMLHPSVYQRLITEGGLLDRLDTGRRMLHSQLVAPEHEAIQLLESLRANGMRPLY